MEVVKVLATDCDMRPLALRRAPVPDGLDWDTDPHDVPGAHTADRGPFPRRSASRPVECPACISLQDFLSFLFARYFFWFTGHTIKHTTGTEIQKANRIKKKKNRNRVEMKCAKK